MSFVRMPRRSQSLSGRSKKQTRKKTTWDDTTSDLTVHKLNQDEIDRRHKVHQSNNLDAIKDEKRRRALLKAKKQRSLSEGNQAGLLREILYDELQLNAALAHSDRVMAVVKDLFYDDPKRLKAVPHITRAPAGHGDKRAGGPIAEGPTHTSYLDTLSESVMDPSALNDYQEEEEEESESDDSGESADERDQYVLDTRLNIGHRRKVIDDMADQHVNEGNADPQGRCGDKENVDPSKTPDRQNTALSQQRAINDTAKVKKKARSRSKGKGHQSPQLNITQKTTPEDLTMLLNELMTACSAFDESRVGVGGESSASHLSPSLTSSSSSGRGFPQLSGYTAFLVQTLTRILTHLTQNEARLREQAAERRRLEEAVSQQRQLIDAMTVDSLQSQELNMQIQTEARKQIQQLELRLQVVEHLLVNQDLGQSDHPPLLAENKPDVPVKDSHLKTRGAASPAELQKTAANTLPPSIPAQQGTDDVKPGATVSMGHPGGLQGASANKTLPGQGSAVRLDQTVGVNGVKPMSSVHPCVTAKPPATDAIMRGVRGNVVGGTGSSQPHLSQHTIERMRSLSGNSTDNEPQTTKSQVAALLQRHPRSDGAHQDRMMRPVQTNLPRGVEILGSRTAQNIGWSVDGVSSMHKQGGLSTMPSDLYTGGGNLGSRTQEKLPGAFGASSEERELDEGGLSHDGHLAPIQPAMLLSPPRQKDRRDFIKPPGYLQQASHNHRPALAHRNYPSQHEQHTLGKGKIFPNFPQTAGSETGKHQQQHPTSLHTGVPQHSLSLESQHPPQHPLFNNYTDGQSHVGDHERALSIMSADSSSTRYLSLPGDTRDTRLVRSLLQPAGQGAGQGGQDHPRARPAQAGGHLVSMVTLPEASLNGTAEGDGAAEGSVDLNDKIATLSRQRVEAQARLQQLKDTYGSSGRAGEVGSIRDPGRAVGLNTASQRPTTSGAEATNQVQPSGSYNRNTAALVGASPPISPIGRTPPTHRPMTTGTSHVASEGRTIHVAMPRVHELEISATSTPASKRTSLGSEGPSPGLDQHDWKTPIKDSPGQDQFFALKAHVSS